MPSFGDLLGFFNSIFKLKFRKLDGEHAKLGIAALQTSREIFMQSLALGGMLSLPWRINGKVVHAELLSEELNLLGIRANDKILKSKCDEISNLLKELELNATSYSMIYVEGYTGAPNSESGLNLKLANKQQIAYDKALPLIKEAILRIGKLESRL